MGLRPLFFTFALSLWSAVSPASDCNPIWEVLGFRQEPFQNVKGKGPRQYFISRNDVPKRKIQDIQQLKIGEYNVKDFYRRHPGISNQDYRKALEAIPVKSRTSEQMWELKNLRKDKSEDEIRRVANTIAQDDDDILVLSEMDDLDSCAYLNVNYLGAAYQVILIRGNDSSGLNICTLVKKDLPFDLEYLSHREAQHVDPQTGRQRKLFSRDLPLLLLRPAGAKTDSDPFLVLAGVHFISQRNTTGIRGGIPDAQVRANIVLEDTQKRNALRQASAEKTVQILKPYIDKKTTVILTGDFNAEVSLVTEFESIRKTGFKDAFDLLAMPTPISQRYTYTGRVGYHEVVQRQIDAAMIWTDQKDLVTSVRVSPDRDINNLEMKSIKTGLDLEGRGSDHQKLETVINFSFFHDFFH